MAFRYFNGFPAVLFTFPIPLLHKTCNICDFVSRQDTNLAKQENQGKAGVEAEAVVGVPREKEERKVERNLGRLHPLKQSEMWIC